MSCATNYIWVEAKDRKDFGLGGGSALARGRVETSAMMVSAYDESNAFSCIEIPNWMRAWFCAPPVLAAAVWSVLTKEDRRRFEPHDIIFPCYGRLAMGCSHSVYILMSINCEHSFRILMTQRRRLFGHEPLDVQEDDT